MVPLSWKQYLPNFATKGQIQFLGIDGLQIARSRGLSPAPIRRQNKDPQIIRRAPTDIDLVLVLLVYPSWETQSTTAERRWPRRRASETAPQSGRLPFVHRPRTVA